MTKNFLKIVGCLFFSLALTGCSAPKITSLRDPGQTVTDTKGAAISTTDIKIKNGRFTPDNVSINKGDVITFTNLDSTPHTIASNPHPTHADLPDLFSPPIYQGKSYQHTFEKFGFYGVHLEENPSVSAKIMVK